MAYRDAGRFGVRARFMTTWRRRVGRLPAWLERIVGRPSRPAFLLSWACAGMMDATRREATRAEHNGWLGIAIATIAWSTPVATGRARLRSRTRGLVARLCLSALGSLAMIRAFDPAPRPGQARPRRRILVHAVVFIVFPVRAIVGPRPRDISPNVGGHPIAQVRRFRSPPRRRQTHT